MKTLIFIMLIGLVPLFGSCTKLFDGKFVYRGGKESPFRAPDNKSAPPGDPTSPFQF